ncbi:hypothetical protein KBB27_00355 [Patescibacteria group bacterium]|nr:hypothetical protein [Patescibacteria group bacterium]
MTCRLVLIPSDVQLDPFWELRASEAQGASARLLAAERSLSGLLAIHRLDRLCGFFSRAHILRETASASKQLAHAIRDGLVARSPQKEATKRKRKKARLALVSETLFEPDQPPHASGVRSKEPPTSPSKKMELAFLSLLDGISNDAERVGIVIAEQGVILALERWISGVLPPLATKGDDEIFAFALPADIQARLKGTSKTCISR